MPSLDVVLEALSRAQITVADLIISLLTSHQYKEDYLVVDLIQRSADIFDAFLQPAESRDKFKKCSLHLLNKVYLQEIQTLASEDSGSHFGASHTSTKQLEDFSLEEMVETMRARAPYWFSLLGMIL
ncbi:hypothetical protein PAXINDRAFT_34447, partial [Paxillus involutus ATCC 200175]